MLDEILRKGLDKKITKDNKFPTSPNPNKNGWKYTVKYFAKLKNPCEVSPPGQ